jgi:hypothetical protein
MGHAFKLFHKRNSRGWRLEGEEKKEFRGKNAGRRKVMIVRMNALVRARVKRLAKNSPTLASLARMGHPPCSKMT